MSAFPKILETNRHIDMEVVIKWSIDLSYPSFCLKISFIWGFTNINSPRQLKCLLNGWWFYWIIFDISSSANLFLVFCFISIDIFKIHIFTFFVLISNNPTFYLIKIGIQTLQDNRNIAWKFTHISQSFNLETRRLKVIQKIAIF